MSAMAAPLVLLVLMSAAWISHSARILGIIPTPSISHQLPFRYVALEFAKRGHQVTVITTDPIRESIENYTEIDVSHTYEYWRSTYDFASMPEITSVDLMYMLMDIGDHVCNIQLGSPQLDDFLNAQQTFDVVILERVMYLCYYGLVHKLGSPPLIGFVSFGASSSVLINYGNPFNPAITPDISIGYSHHMSFWERVYNTYLTLRLNYMVDYQLAPRQEAIIRKYFGAISPSVYETERNFSLLLVNNHFSMNYPRPLVPNTVELTGLHVQKELQPLSKDIQQFLDGAESGFIYFSLGSNVMGSAMPQHKLRAFLEAFSQLPQRVLWKWEADSLPGRPSNVMTAKWLPQTSVLAHPNIRLFITQGGLQSMNEAGYFGVPMVGIPFIGDQLHNVAKIVHAGIGCRLHFKDVTKESVLTAIRTLIDDESYQENMRRFSAVYREHQSTSLEKAVWWVEYVIRHQGAPQMRSAALDLSWWQLLLLDVIAFIVVVAAFTAYLLYCAIRFTLRSVQCVQKQKVS